MFSGIWLAIGENKTCLWVLLMELSTGLEPLLCFSLAKGAVCLVQDLVKLEVSSRGNKTVLLSKIRGENELQMKVMQLAITETAQCRSRVRAEM